MGSTFSESEMLHDAAVGVRAATRRTIRSQPQYPSSNAHRKPGPIVQANFSVDRTNAENTNVLLLSSVRWLLFSQFGPMYCFPSMQNTWLNHCPFLRDPFTNRALILHFRIQCLRKLVNMFTPLSAHVVPMKPSRGHGMSHVNMALRYHIVKQTQV